jgi:hypothetical protein
VDGAPDPGPGCINWLNDTELDLNVYRCPADTGYAGGGFLHIGGRGDRNERAWRDEGMSAYDHYGNSYAANTFWMVGDYGGDQVRSQSPYLLPLSRVPAPEHTVAYDEMPARYVWAWGDWDGSGCEWVGHEYRFEGHFATVPGWHGMPFHFNLGFSDGHAALTYMQGCIRAAPDIGEAFYPPDYCGSPAASYECFRCVTVRGPEWRLDTLPSPPVLTPFFAD